MTEAEPVSETSDLKTYDDEHCPENNHIYENIPLTETLRFILRLVSCMFFLFGNNQ
jgi:hypothetical protein